MAGGIVIVTGELTRYATSMQSIFSLDLPEHVLCEWTAGVNVAKNLNIGITNLLAKNPALEWVWIMGDDHRFSPDIVNRLLKHEVDVVCPLVAKRIWPFVPVAYKREFLQPGYYEPTGYTWLPPTGLQECEAISNAGMLIRRHVIDALGPKWFEVGQTDTDVLGEDLWFCKKARKAGFKLFVDVDTKMGHVTTMTVWPSADMRPGADLEVSPNHILNLRFQGEEFTGKPEGVA